MNFQSVEEIRNSFRELNTESEINNELYSLKKLKSDIVRAYKASEQNINDTIQYYELLLAVEERKNSLLKKNLDTKSGALYAYEREANDPFKKIQKNRKENNLIFVIVLLCLLSGFFFSLFIYQDISLTFTIIKDNIVEAILYGFVLAIISAATVIEGILPFNKEKSTFLYAGYAIVCFAVIIVMLMLR